MFQNKNIRFVLINTTHPGNIGATARAMKNMGFENLYLVSPKYYPHSEAMARASGAEDILEKAVVVSTLQEAVADCNLIFGTSSRERAIPIPLSTPREAAHLINNYLKDSNSVAILFGQERMGLTNEELELCQYQLYIPCNPDFASLNIAAAVQVIAYELHVSLDPSSYPASKPSDLVNSEAMERFYEHLEKTLIEIQFLNPDNPRQMMRKLRRLFNRISIEQNEMNILRGILSTIARDKTGK